MTVKGSSGITLHKVRRGETLSSISRFHYGAEGGWRVIAETNGLKSPYKIFVGMVLTVPRRSAVRTGAHGRTMPQVRDYVHHSSSISHTLAGAVQRPASVGGLRPANQTPSLHMPEITLLNSSRAKNLRYPPVKVKLDDWVKPIEQRFPKGSIKLQFTGELTLQREGDIATLDFSKDGFAGATVKLPNGTYVLNPKSELSGEVTSEYRGALADLTSGTKFGWNPATKEISVSCKFSLASKVNGQVFATSAISVEPLLPRGLKCKYSYQPRPVEGSLGTYKFEGKVGFEAELRAEDDDDAQGEQIREIVFEVGAAAVIVTAVVVLAPAELIVGAAAAIGETVAWLAGWGETAGVALAVP